MSVTAAQGFVAAGIACGVKEIGDRDLSLTASIGVTIYDGNPASSQDVLRDAELATRRERLDAAEPLDVGGQEDEPGDANSLGAIYVHQPKPRIHLNLEISIKRQWTRAAGGFH